MGRPPSPDLLPEGFDTLGRVRLRATTEDDLPFVLEAECHPANAPFVGQWPEGRHREAMASPRWLHGIATSGADARRVGYVILSGVGEPTLELTRMVVTEKGRGLGRDLLRLLVRAAFGHLGAHRFWLDVMPHNQRAWKLYASEGFVEEGRLREAAWSEGRPVDLVVLSVLAREYEARDPTRG